MRLFFGLSLPGSIRAVTRACAESAALSIPGRYPPAENHHVTLAFLGEVPPERLPAARDVLARCAAALPAPTLPLPGFGRCTTGLSARLRKRLSPPIPAPSRRISRSPATRPFRTRCPPACPSPLPPRRRMCSSARAIRPACCATRPLKPFPSPGHAPKTDSFRQNLSALFHSNLKIFKFILTNVTSRNKLVT